MSSDPLPGRQLPARWLARMCAVSIAVSSGLLITVAALGPSAGVPGLPGALPWPVFVGHARPAPLLVAALLWLAALSGGGGVAAGLVAVRRGWRPRLRVLAALALLAVVALMLLPPVGSSDLLDDAVYGRIAALGHSPYRMNPHAFQRTGDPIAFLATRRWVHDRSPYGPLVTLTQLTASDLSGDSAARTVFWLKAWNALAFLAVALALDRLLRSDAAGRARAHLLWTVNPLMLLAVLAGGHNDVLGAGFGLLAVAAFRRAGFAGGVLAGALAGAAIAMKAPFILIALGLAIAAIRSPRTLAGLAAGAVAVVVPSYLVAGKGAVAAVVADAGRATDPYQPWQLVVRVLPYFHTVARTDVLGLAGTIALAALLLWRLPAGAPRLPAVRPTLALTLAWLVCSPQQRAWYDVMIFPLLALLPATRLDWIALARSAVAALGELPGGIAAAHQLWLGRATDLLDKGIVPLALAALALALVWLCLTGRWQASSPATPVMAVPDAAVPG